MDPTAAPTSIRRDDSLRAAIRDRLRSFEVRSIVATRHAAVAVALIDEGPGADLDGMPRHAVPSERAAILLTRRAASMRNHPGQWALPGGLIDPGETPEQAAMRELAEEVDLRVGPECVLGRLDDFATRSGFVITPVIVWAGPGEFLVANPDEVQSVHRIPVEEFLRADAPILEPLPESREPVLKMPVGDTWIAAPTAAILYQFREVCLLGRPTRVAHFEQPLFAWR